MIKVLLFDMNGVLVSNFSNDVWDRHASKLELTNDELRKTFKEYVLWENVNNNPKTEDFWRIKKGDWKNIKLDDLNNLLRDLHQSEKLDETMIKLLKDLKHDYKIGVLSNVSGVLKKLLKEKYNFNELVDFPFSSGEIGYAKPDKRIFQHILSKTGVSPEELVFIDDKEVNVLVAKELGINAIHFLGKKELISKLNALGVKLS